MASFICAVHASGTTPTAVALVEQTPGADGPTYAVRALRTLSGEDPAAALFDLLASEPQYAAHTTVVTTGGQKAADALHERGPSAVAVTLRGEGSSDLDAQDTTVQVLVDTFERLYRDGVVDVPGSLDEASGAVDALYSVADLDAAANPSDRDAEGDLPDEQTDTMGGATYAGSGPSAVVVEQSGSEANVSTEVIPGHPDRHEASTAMADRGVRQSRVAASTGAAAPDLGDHADTAIALALACWYGETSRDDLPATDQMDEALANRVNRPARRN